MSDDQPTTPADDAELTVDAAAVTDGAYTLAVADFDDTEAAWAAYELLKSVEDGRTVKIEGVILQEALEDYLQNRRSAYQSNRYNTQF